MARDLTRQSEDRAVAARPGTVDADRPVEAVEIGRRYGPTLRTLLVRALGDEDAAARALPSLLAEISRCVSRSATTGAPLDDLVYAHARRWIAELANRPREDRPAAPLHEAADPRPVRQPPRPLRVQIPTRRLIEETPPPRRARRFVVWVLAGLALTAVTAGATRLGLEWWQSAADSPPAAPDAVDTAAAPDSAQTPVAPLPPPTEPAPQAGPDLVEPPPTVTPPPAPPLASEPPPSAPADAASARPEPPPPPVLADPAPADAVPPEAPPPSPIEPTAEVLQPPPPEPATPSPPAPQATALMPTAPAAATLPPTRLGPPGTPRVYLHHTTGDRVAAASADALAARIRARGITVAGIRPVPFAMGAGGVRYYHEADATLAGDLAQDCNGQGVPQLCARGAQDFRSFTPPPLPGTVEIWLATSSSR